MFKSRDKKILLSIATIAAILFLISLGAESAGQFSSAKIFRVLAMFCAFPLLMLAPFLTLKSLARIPLIQRAWRGEENPYIAFLYIILACFLIMLFKALIALVMLLPYRMVGGMLAYFLVIFIIAMPFWAIISFFQCLFKPAATLPFPPAGFWRRLGAYIIDAIIVAIPIWILSAVAGVLSFTNPTLPFEHPEMLVVTQIVSLVICIGYHAVFISSKWQATPGKRLLEVYVVHAGDYLRLTLPQAAARYCMLHLPSMVLAVFFILQPNPLMWITPNLTPEERNQIAQAIERRHESAPLTEEQQQFLSPGGQATFDSIKTKLDKNIPLAPNEQDFLNRMMLPVLVTLHAGKDDRADFIAMQDKVAKHVALTAPEQQRINYLAGALIVSGMVKDDYKTFRMGQQPFTPEQKEAFDKMGAGFKDFFGAPFFFIIIFMQLYFWLQAAMIAWSRQKTGIHDLVCKTRVIEGLPPNA